MRKSKVIKFQLEVILHGTVGKQTWAAFQFQVSGSSQS